MQTVKIGDNSYERVGRSTPQYRLGKFLSICNECAEVNKSNCVLIKHGVPQVISTCNTLFGEDGFPRLINP